MFKNYVKMSWRILLNQKLFSFINIVGLAIGMAGCLLIVKYISFELSYDNFQKNGNFIYRIKHQNYSQGNLIENFPKTYSAVAPALKAEFPEIKDVTRVNKLDGIAIAQQSNGSLIAFNEHDIYAVDPSFLRIFSVDMLKGTTDALHNNNSIVITQKTASKYFPNQDPLGKVIKIEQQESGTSVLATINGVCRDVPSNSHMQYDFLVSNNLDKGDWIYPDYYTYVQLASNTNKDRFETMLATFLKKRASMLEGNSSYTMGKSNLSNIVYTLQPLKDIHLYSNLTQEIGPSGDGDLVWDLGLIAILILVIAYLNYVNLSTAKIVERAKEVGVRKVLGAPRGQLIMQFLFESLLVSLISIFVALIIIYFTMPTFSKFCGNPLYFNLKQDYLILSGFIVVVLLGVLASALYPALILSNYRPIQILKGKFHHTSQSLTLRKGLVVFQFVTTICFVISTVVIYNQLKYMKTANKGMDVSQTLVLLAPENLRANDQEAATFAAKDSSFQSELIFNPRVSSVTSSSSIPGKYVDFKISYKRQSQSGTEKDLRLATFEIGHNFFKQFKTKLTAGRQFTENVQFQRAPMILNEAAVIALGFTNSKNAVGAIIETQNSKGRIFENEVVGVIENFHQTSLKDAFTPTVFRLIDPSSTKYYEIKINSNYLPETIESVKQRFKSFFPNSAFEFFFLDDYFNQQYKLEQHFEQLFTLFSGFAIFIACLGLFGLTLITVTQRVKEIGIRKVLGASITNILFLLTKDYIKLILIANVIAIPISYLSMHSWLENYHFRIQFNIWYFILPMLFVFFIAIFTILLQVLKAALTKPVTSLRTE